MAVKPASQTHIRNITHKKQLEEHLARTDKLASLGQLAAGVAHEMNNPLGSIMVLSYLLLEDMKEDCAERGQIDKIIKEATRCKEIVQGLLEFSRYMPSRMAPLQLNSLLEEVLFLVGGHLLFQHIDLVKEFHPELPLVLGDKNRLEQVFINLLMNSGDAMEGMGRLTVSTGLHPEGDRVRLAFQDTGPGIPESLLGRLFDPFFTTKRVGKGWGWVFPSVTASSKSTWAVFSWSALDRKAPPSWWNCRCTGKNPASPFPSFKNSRRFQPAFFSLCGLMAQAKLSWPILATPVDEKCGTAPGCSLVEQARAPALHRHAGFHGKACGYKKILSPRFHKYGKFRPPSPHALSPRRGEREKYTGTVFIPSPPMGERVRVRGN
jgi:hypothetical protein